MCVAVSHSLSFSVCLSDPESEVPIAQALYGNDEFMRAFYNSLSDDGILVMQLGEAPKFNSPDETYSKFRNRASTTSFLEKLGFESIHVYEEVRTI
jgi:spermidine synthase